MQTRVALTSLGLVQLLVTLQTAWSAPHGDLVTYLPGLKFAPDFKQYAGYLQATGSRQLHYWFVESSRDPSSDPLVLWLEGGPGCSAEFSMLAKHGPFRVGKDGYTVTRNPFAFNQVANIIYLDSPAGVGFSYSADKNYTTSDDETAENNFAALKDFLMKFPEYALHDFYIAGASYGGIYVPVLAQLVMKDASIYFKGFSVGNGLSDYKLNTNSLVYYVYYHGLLGQDEWYGLLKDCCPKNDSSDCDFDGSQNPGCMKRMRMIQDLVWSSGFDPYNLYKDCYGGADDEGDHSLLLGENGKTRPFRPFTVFPSQDDSTPAQPLPRKSNEMLICRDDRQLPKYLNREDVKKALHVSAKAKKWTLCSELNYQQQYKTMRPQYQAAIKKKLRMIVYNGDFDMACNYLGDEWFVDSLNAKNPKKRRMWYYTAADHTRQNAGFVKEYDQVTFATIRGAGHMAPEDKPRPSLELFTKFLANKPL